MCHLTVKPNILAKILAISILALTASHLYAEPREVSVSKINPNALISIGRLSSGQRVSCLVRSSKALTGVVVTKRLQKRQVKVWQDFRYFIEKIRDLSFKRKRKLNLVRIKFTKRCQAFANILATPNPTIASQSTPTPTSLPTSTPTSDPTLTPTAQPTATATATNTETPTPSVTVTPTYTSTPTPTATPTLSTQRIRAGGGSITDINGDLWESDAGLFSGTTGTYYSAAPIYGCEDAALYQQERYSPNMMYSVPVVNGEYRVRLHFAELYFNAAGKRLFDVNIEGVPALHDFDIWADAGKNVPVVKEFNALVSDGVLNISFVKSIDNAKISAIEILPGHPSHPHLHAIINAPESIVDYDGSGEESILLDGSKSHTHELGKHLVEWQWRVDGNLIGDLEIQPHTLSLGSHDVTLTIVDDNLPAQTLIANRSIRVFPLSAVAGVVAEYYSPSSGSLSALLDAPPSIPDFREFIPALGIRKQAGKIGGSPFLQNVVVALKANILLPSSGNWLFIGVGGVESRIFIDDAPVTGAVQLDGSPHKIEARFAVDSITSLPIEVRYQKDSEPQTAIAPYRLSHDRSTLLPFMTDVPKFGAEGGGETIQIKGSGFFPTDGVQVFWDGAALGSEIQSITPEAITLNTPPGSGVVQIYVQTPNGTSNTVDFQYLVGSAVAFDTPVVSSVPGFPTQAAWGPDGRLYVTSLFGEITAYSFDNQLNIVAQQNITALTEVVSKNILGIAFDPLAPASPVRIYVAHSALYPAGGDPNLPNPVPYLGQVSYLDGPNFDTVHPVVTGLPVSNHDHGVNGLAFNNYGELLVAVGGNTNAGVIHPNIGNLPESPFSAAILKVPLHKAGFNGDIQYYGCLSSGCETDQRFGDQVRVVSGVDVEIFSSGFRNPFDLVFATSGNAYCTDNGPNQGFGAASTSAATQAADPEAPDELNLLVQGGYYGHPNRNRGQFEERENVYRSPLDSPILGSYLAPISSGPPLPSTDGVDEYRSQIFDGQLRGNILAKRYGQSELYSFKLDSSGRSLSDLRVLGTPWGLDVSASPGGNIIVVGPDQYGLGTLSVLRPLYVSQASIEVYDIFPWRGRADGSVPFVISGKGFGTLADTHVHIGEVEATLTEITPTRIKGLIPAVGSPTPELLDVEVHSPSGEAVIERAFRYVFESGAGVGRWQDAANIPANLGEVAAGEINGVIYVVGEGSSNTWAYDIASDTWTAKASRPYQGDHHSAEVIAGKLYLFGGVTEGTDNTPLNKVQIFDPVLNSWSLGTDIPDGGAGSASTSKIDGKVYLAGGLTDLINGTNAYVYDPSLEGMPLGPWQSIAPMPKGVNHAASSNDGQRLFIFGGRQGLNFPQDGVADVQIYDPVTNTWEWSGAPGSVISPMPAGRGGTGKAVYFRNEFYVMGGEGDLELYGDVLVYNPTLNSWRFDTPMQYARHGIFPILANDHIHVFGGSITAPGHSDSGVHEAFSQ